MIGKYESVYRNRVGFWHKYFFILYLRFFLIVLFINIAIASKLERAKAIAVAIF